MSISQTYSLAHTARSKLSSEAARADHDLRLLVGHANLLDSLMLDLTTAEREQESWFNQSVQAANKYSRREESSSQHIQWADTIVEDPEEDWDADDADSSDSDDSGYAEDAETSEPLTPLYRTSSHAEGMSTSVREIEDDSDLEDDDDDDEEEDYASLSLAPSPSQSPISPPELSHDSSDSESDDESMPPSPPSTARSSFSEKQQIATTSFYSSPNSQALTPTEQASLLNEGYFIPPRSPQNLVGATMSVY